MQHQSPALVGQDWDLERIGRALADPAAMEDLYRSHYPMLFGMSMRWLMNVDDAEDATADAFLRMIQSIRRFEWRGRSFSSWLRRILLNVINDRWRRQNKLRFVSLDLETDESKSLLDRMASGDESQSERVLRLERFHAIRAALGQLSPQHQDVLMLRYFEELPPREIAFVTGANVGIVKWRLHVASRKIRTILGNHELFKREIRS